MVEGWTGRPGSLPERPKLELDPDHTDAMTPLTDLKKNKHKNRYLKLVDARKTSRSVEFTFVSMRVWCLEAILLSALFFKEHVDKGFGAL